MFALKETEMFLQYCENSILNLTADTAKHNSKIDNNCDILMNIHPTK